MIPQNSPGLPRRLAALVYDTFLVLPLIMLSTAVAMGVQLVLARAGDSTADVAPLSAWLVQLLVVATTTAFYCCFWRIRGQTLGMQAWRIRLRSFDGSTAAGISLKQALVRCAGAVLSLLPLGAGYWWCLFDDNGRYWHDYLSRTELELMPKGRK
jgi:uncharacterized RDD family membrane protein YckC